MLTATRSAAASSPKKTTKPQTAKPKRAKPKTAKRGAAKPSTARKRGAKPTAAAKPRRRWLRLVLWGGGACIWLALAFLGLLVWYGQDLPQIDRLADDGRRPSITLAAADGSTIASYGDLYGEPLRVEEMSPYLPQAVIAIEDRRYYDHFGLDPLGIARAALVNLRAGRLVQGGSTLTQQLAKNLFLTPERSLKRKIQEALLALQLEGRYSKEQILTLYLNRVYLGAGTYGVDAAARRYFGKSARDVTLYEAALLAGLLKAPSRLNPTREGERGDQRAKLVLDAMVRNEVVTEAEAEAAFAAKSSGKPPGYDRGRYFGDWALRQTQETLGSVRRDLRVDTTLDPRIQAIAERTVSAVLADEGVAKGASQAAVVAMRPDGAILAMVGGEAYRASQFNRATQALRQPGSSFKLFVYLAGLEAGLRPDTGFVDRKIKVGDWEPGNYNDRYRGAVTLREAFARSLNSVAVQVAQQVGVSAMIDSARRLGITTPLPQNLTLSLGAGEVTLLELTGAFAVFANQGRSVWPYGIKTIQGREGTTLFRRPEEVYHRVVRPQTVDAMNDLLHAVVSWGTGRRADPGRPAAGKTGTSQDFRDAWFVGFTADLVVGVWVGNDDGTPMDKVTGGRLPAEIWRRIVTAAEEGRPVRPLPNGGSPAASDPQPAAPLVSQREPQPAPVVQSEPKDLIGDLLGTIERDETSNLPLPRALDSSTPMR
ncbi:MAG: PBP1A family penicillin-binding protein [Rhodospirillales bacterium]